MLHPIYGVLVFFPAHATPLSSSGICSFNLCLSSTRVLLTHLLGARVPHAPPWHAPPPLPLGPHVNSSSSSLLLQWFSIVGSLFWSMELPRSICCLVSYKHLVRCCWCSFSRGLGRVEGPLEVYVPSQESWQCCL